MSTTTKVKRNHSPNGPPIITQLEDDTTVDETTVDNPDSQHAMGDKLHQHVRVNAISDYYDLPKLRQLSRENLSRECKVNGVDKTLLSATKEARTTSGDVHLHETLATIAAQNIRSLYDKDGFAELCTDFSAKIIFDIIPLLVSLEAEVCELDSRLKRAEVDIATEHMQLKNEATAQNSTIQSMRACHRNLRKTKFCRNVNCEAEFTCYIEEERKGNGESAFNIRCAKCRCKHT